MKNALNIIEPDQTEFLDPESEALIEAIGAQARNLYLTRQLLCTEAVVEALNDTLGGDLTKSQVVALTAPFCVAMGESGCMCGALSGAVIACGLFLGDRHPYRNRKQMRDSARQLHDEFKSRNGATCCSALIRKVKHDKGAHFRQCADITEKAAEMAARKILKNRPELASRAERKGLARRQSVISSAVSRLIRLFSE
jgi:C_GCAxxG_C_C family probable redox protein